MGLWSNSELGRAKSKFQDAIATEDFGLDSFHRCRNVPGVFRWLCDDAAHSTRSRICADREHHARGKIVAGAR